MTDLTERLAAKLMEVNLPSDADASIYVATLPRPHAPGYRLRVGKDAADLLPLLLSEPELVASLPDEVRRSVLTKREQAVLRHGEAVYAHNVLLRERWNDFAALEESDEEIRLSMRALQKLALDAALTTNPVAPEFDL